MANPAEALHAILSGWLNEDKTAIYMHRGIGGGGEDTTMKMHRRAMILIHEIEQILNGMQPTPARAQSNERNIAKWTKWVMAYPHDWLQQPRTDYANLNDIDALDALDMIAQLLESHVPTIGIEQRESYSESIIQILQALSEDDSLPKDLKQHVYMLVSNARRCIEEYDLVGDFALQAAMERLASAVATAAHQSNKPAAWQAFKDKFFWPVAGSLVVGVPQIAIAMQVGGA